MTPTAHPEGASAGVPVDTLRASLLMKERELLKNELQTLKQCQVQYFTVSITATGVVLGLAEKLGAEPGGGLIYLAAR